MTLDDLRLRAIQSACDSLKDPGPPLNPGIFTDKGFALFTDDASVSDPGSAAISMLKQLEGTVRPDLYALFMEHQVNIPGKDPAKGIVIVSGGRGLPPQENQFFVYEQAGDFLASQEPPEVFEIGPSPSLFDHLHLATSSHEWIWRDYA